MTLATVDDGLITVAALGMRIAVESADCIDSETAFDPREPVVGIDCTKAIEEVSVTESVGPFD